LLRDNVGKFLLRNFRELIATIFRNFRNWATPDFATELGSNIGSVVKFSGDESRGCLQDLLRDNVGKFLNRNFRELGNLVFQISRVKNTYFRIKLNMGKV